MMFRGKVSSIEGGKYRVTFPDRENIVSYPLIKAEHVGLLNIGDNVVVAFFAGSLDGIIIARF